MAKLRSYKARNASRRNIRRAQLSRFRTREPRSVGRVRPARRSAFGRYR